MWFDAICRDEEAAEFDFSTEFIFFLGQLKMRRSTRTKQSFDRLQKFSNGGAEDEDVVDEFANVGEAGDDEVAAAVPFVSGGGEAHRSF